MKKNMRHPIIYFLLLICIILYSGCKSNQEKVKDYIKQMESNPFAIPYSKMSCWINDSIQLKRPWEKAKMKLVVYTDSTKCSECTLKNMYMWEDFVKLEKQYHNEFEIIYIFQTKKGLYDKKLASLFYLTELFHPMYVDSKSFFSKVNPQLPKESLYHIFLLDENNSVILVGNPLFNPKLEKMLRRILQEKFKK